MTVSTDRSVSAIAPTEKDATEAGAARRVLASYSLPQPLHALKLILDDATGSTVTIPAAAYKLLVEILAQMAEGNAVSIVPIKKEITTQEAADILNVSRPYFVKLLESGKIPYRKVGTRRRVLTTDVLDYKNQIDTQRMQTLMELAAQAQELNMGY
ncbi:DNA binding domain protein, excisionase family (plasmid) [Crinalium epipsammum PCC 9333]|uniref:DNA binding domain protein, excisionase family n=1 Tax=Crinalium epipsammum PCC 9333 TaxID=1173022 RepID=K9W7G4_9CYAN|nr:excisionase family DNA-binding protein [Crinalium epipsammum]AFZ15682.1 DNA binding domain protein, excisionase family [Crinalium epipsammum PCC 9333]